LQIHTCAKSFLCASSCSTCLLPSSSTSSSTSPPAVMQGSHRSQHTPHGLTVLQGKSSGSAAER
jgi:hypothetical protein